MTDSDAGVYPPNVHRAYYRALFESLPYGVCRTDEHGTVQEANQALLTMMACNSVIEIAASDLTKKIIGDANERARVFESESEGEKVDTELDWVREDGVALRVRVSGRDCGNSEALLAHPFAQHFGVAPLWLAVRFCSPPPGDTAIGTFLVAGQTLWRRK